MESRIKFKIERVLKNGNKLNKTNWKHVVAVSNQPCTNVKGVPIIDQTIMKDGVYYEKWVLKRECKGYIFWEINHYGGISGYHPSYKSAIMSALTFPHISVYLEVETKE